VNNKKLPLHLMIPRADGKGPEEYTLVAAPFVSLDGNATAAPAAGAKPAAGADTFSCSLDKLKVFLTSFNVTFLIVEIDRLLPPSCTRTGRSVRHRLTTKFPTQMLSAGFCRLASPMRERRT